MRLEKKQHLCLIKEDPTTFKPPHHEFFVAFTAADAKESALAKYPKAHVLVIESR